MNTVCKWVICINVLWIAFKLCDKWMINEIYSVYNFYIVPNATEFKNCLENYCFKNYIEYLLLIYYDY